MAMKPLYDRVVIRRSKVADITKGGIVIPDSMKEDDSTGEVLAVGGGRLMTDGKLCPLTVKVGDRVVFEKRAGIKVTAEDEELLVIRENEIIAVLS